MSFVQPVEPIVDISVEAEGWGDEGAVRAIAERAIAAAIAEEGLQMVAGSEVSLVLSDDARIRALNKSWRGKDKPTNVLSFPGDDGEEAAFGPLLGDIVIALETVEREARDLAKPFDEHLTHLIVHGTLHLFGYDHQIDEEAEEMEDAERRILARLGFSDPYLDAPLMDDDSTEGRMVRVADGK